jgi:mono/diheme cytochrome c family protein
MEFVDSLIAEVANPWRDAPNRAVQVAARPDDWSTPVSIDRGKELYFGNVANCVKCHGEMADGEGVTDDWDDWTKEMGDPQDVDVVRRFTALGAMKPRHITPRNLRQGVFRGGRRPEDLYRRIINGIGGTPMPAAPMKPHDAAPDDPRLTTDDVWHLVAYVRQLAFESQGVPGYEDLTYAGDGTR